MLKSLNQYIVFIKQIGLSYVLYRLVYLFQKKTGYLKWKYPSNPRPGQMVTLEDWRRNAPDFFFACRDDLKVPVVQNEDLKKKAKRILNGEYLFFSKHWIALEHDEWHTNPLTGYNYDRHQHWSNSVIFSAKAGDIKYVWERGRFCYLYDIIRYDHHYQEDHAGYVFDQIISFIDNNPINCGPHYASSQEIALRILNWTFAVYFYKDSPLLTEERFFVIMNAIYWQLKHVHDFVWYSLKIVRNNHAISEAAALLTGGLLFPFMEGAAKWKEHGKAWLEKEILYQVYEDGTYLQYSMNYHRVVVQLMTWTLRLVEMHHLSIDPVVIERARRSVTFLASCCDHSNGMLPLYGANDGALFFPLNNCDYRDFRAQLNALSLVVDKKPIWDDAGLMEDAEWFMNRRVNAKPKPSGGAALLAFDIGGYFVIREHQSLTFIRCGSHLNRPSHADNLHLDLWADGQNIFHDAGSYLYNTSRALATYFQGTTGHNTVMLNNQDQMLKGPRFIWFNWSRAIYTELLDEDDSYLFRGKIRAFSQLGANIEHERTVKKSKNTLRWEITDRVTHNPGFRMIQLWHPSEIGWKEYLVESYDEHDRKLKPETRQGWYSDYYGYKEERNYFFFQTESNYLRTVIRQKRT